MGERCSVAAKRIEFSRSEKPDRFSYRCRNDELTVSEDTDLSTVLAVLDDEYAREILTNTSIEPMSASTLSERCDASLPTIYRRLERLEECHLVTEETELAPDGNHFSVYSANLDRLELSLEDGSFALELTYRDEDVADKFTRLWEGMR
ncbi:Helix-turn-helix domain-containing protein [Natronorubrum thiooxidans]|uniref:Helix-turn-helix domain-containing protein n=1 Tax=Natronorubrum thiooxidans TaxID=308853 RepID=A0A1N7FIM7_9EURY|nr:Helix-turn-helix domain-containing protein [Natronorubrum thiooxidans]